MEIDETFIRYVKAQRADLARLDRDRAWVRLAQIRREESSRDSARVVRAYAVYRIACRAYEAMVAGASVRWNGVGCEF